MTNTTVEFVRKSDAVAELAEAIESEEMMAKELELLSHRYNIVRRENATERTRSGILLVVCILLFLLSVVLLAVLFA